MCQNVYQRNKNATNEKQNLMIRFAMIVLMEMKKINKSVFGSAW